MGASSHPLVPARRPNLAVAGLVVAVVVVLVDRFGVRTVATLALAAAFAASALYVLWRTEPVITFTAALLLAPFSGNWEGVGVPGILSPNRIVLAVAVAAVLLRARPSRSRPRLQPHPAHWLMVAAGAYAVLSAVLSETLDTTASVAGLLERYGILPFLAFFAAPAVFRTARERDILLVALVALGAYLGLTALFETIGLRGLVFPSYINDPTFGILPERARGPFVEPAQNALGMFTCAGACVIALGRWRAASARVFAAVVALLCLAGVLFTLTRAAWLGGGVSVVVMLFVVPRLRRSAIPALAASVLIIAVALVAIPGFSQKASDRRSNEGTVYDRYALNQAAVNMINARPLLGFGWGTYFDHNRDYLQQGADYPLPKNIENVPVHNLYLGYGAELGLVGTGLWLWAMVLAIGGALLRRGDPDSQPWRYLLLAVTIFYLSISNFEPTTTFSTLLLLFLAGVVNGGSPGWAFTPEESPRA